FERLREDERANGLLLAKLWGLIDENIFELARERAAASRNQSSNAEQLRLLESLRAEYPGDERIQQLLAQSTSQSGLPGDQAINSVEADIPGVSGEQPSQALLEHISILDSLNTVGPKESIEYADHRG